MGIDSKQFVIFSKPFIDAAKNVFETIAFTSLQTGKPIIKKELDPKGEVLSRLKLSGVHTPTKKEYEAILTLSCSRETYLNIASAILMEEIRDYDDDYMQIGEELIKMILGSAKRDLTGLGFSSYADENQNQNYPYSSTVVEVPIECSHGKMYFDIYYNDVLGQ